MMPLFERPKPVCVIMGEKEMWKAMTFEPYKSREIIQIIPAPANLQAKYKDPDGITRSNPIIAFALVDNEKENGDVFRSIEAVQLSKNSSNAELVFRDPECFTGFSFYKTLPGWCDDE